MLIHGGEPPFIEKPEPRWGGVISKLNEFTFSLQQGTDSFNQETKDKLLEFTTGLNAFLLDVVIPIDAHFNARGAVHGETKDTIGLPLKDNYRTATLEEQTNLLPVDAYVTPEGLRSAFDNLSPGSGGDAPYQLNDGLSVGMYYYPDDYPTLTPTVAEPTRFFGRVATVIPPSIPESWSCRTNGSKTLSFYLHPTGGFKVPSYVLKEQQPGNSSIPESWRCKLSGAKDSTYYINSYSGKKYPRMLDYFQTTNGQDRLKCLGCNTVWSGLGPGDSRIDTITAEHYTYTPAVPLVVTPESWRCPNTGVKTSSFYYPKWANGKKVPQMIRTQGPNGREHTWIYYCSACGVIIHNTMPGSSGAGVGHWAYTAPSQVPATNQLRCTSCNTTTQGSTEAVYRSFVDSHYNHAERWDPPVPVPEKWTCPRSGLATNSYHYPVWAKGAKFPLMIRSQGPNGKDGTYNYYCAGCGVLIGSTAPGVTGAGIAHWGYTPANSVPPHTVLTNVSDEVSLMVNHDRAVFSPIYDTVRHTRNVLMVSGPLQKKRNTGLQTIPNMNGRFLSLGWNLTGSQSTSGKVALFRPLVDKKIQEYKNNLALASRAMTTLLFNTYVDMVYKGLAVSTSWDGTTLTVHHKFFQVINPETDPALNPLAIGTYPALFTQIGKTPYSAPANGSHSYRVTDFLTLASGQTVTLDDQAGGVIASLVWNVQDTECYLHIAMPLRVSSGGGARQSLFYLEFVESIKPGSLLAGGSATFTLLGSYVKDSLNAAFELNANPRWVHSTDPYDLNNPSLFPGVVTPEGELIKAASNINCIRVKRANVNVGIKPWLLGVKPPIGEAMITREVYAPSRYAALGDMTERVIPLPTPGHTGTRMLVHSIDAARGTHRWKLFDWGETSLSLVAGTAFAVAYPLSITDVNQNVPTPSLVINGSVTNKVVQLSGLAFTSRNGYRGLVNVVFEDNTLKATAPVTLDPAELTLMKQLGAGVMTRAKAANPGVSDTIRELEISVFAINPTLALVLITDGVCYGEVTFTGYQVNNGVFKTNITLQHPLKRVTTTGLTVAPDSRESLTGDGVWQKHSDCFVTQLSASAYAFVISRPFGNLYGDLAFQTAVPSTSVIPTSLAPNPAELYRGMYQFDLVDEVFPPVLIPGKGIYRPDPARARYSNRMSGIGVGGYFDAYEAIGGSWVLIPTGSRVVLGGKAIILDRAYPVKVPASGTAYCYLARQGNDLVSIVSTTMREPSNTEVLIGITTNGLLDINNSYLVIDDHLVSSAHKGSTIPCFSVDGTSGVNTFFNVRDKI